ncbi:hypothetical protein AUP68_16953 [Ilyonectria robusta]
MLEPQVFVFRWVRGGEPTSGFESVANVGAETQWDLRAIISDSDDEQFHTVFSSVIGNEDIWNAFQAEKKSSATHAFGWQRLEDGSEVTWLHLLMSIPSKELEQLGGKGDERDEKDHRVWLKPWVFLRWSLADGGDTEPGRRRFTRISMVCFQSTVELVDRVNILHHSPTWGYVLEDPFRLLEIIFESWFYRVDDVSWIITKAARRIEQDTFNFVHSGRTARRHVKLLDFRRPHVIAKDTIYMLEGLDAALLCLESVSSRHRTFRENNPCGLHTDEWENTEQSLEYRKQLFHSTKLRTTSTNQRMQTAINLKCGDNASTTQEQCNQTAEQILGRRVRPAPVQGSTSYTVVPDDDVGECVVQYRASDSSLDLDFLRCIEQTYGRFVPRHWGGCLKYNSICVAAESLITSVGELRYCGVHSRSSTLSQSLPKTSANVWSSHPCPLAEYRPPSRLREPSMNSTQHVLTLGRDDPRRQPPPGVLPRKLCERLMAVWEEFNAALVVDVAIVGLRRLLVCLYYPPPEWPCHRTRMCKRTIECKRTKKIAEAQV